MTQRQILIGLNFNSQDLTKLKLPSFNGLPTVEESGNVIFNEADDTLYVSDGTIWNQVQGGGGNDNPYVVVNSQSAFANAGTESVSIGGATIGGNSSVSIGTFVSTENAITSVGIGSEITIESNDNYVIGRQNNVDGPKNVLIGYQASSFYDEDGSNIAIGYQAQVYGGDFGIAMGDGAKANNNLSAAIGFRSNSASQAIAYGFQAKANGSNSVALGPNSQSLGQRSVSIGNNSKSGNGFGPYASDDNISIGASSYSKGISSISIGHLASSGSLYQGDDYAIAIGYRSYAYGDDAIAFGSQSITTGPRSVNIGYFAQGFGDDSVTLGSNNSSFYSDDSVIIGTGIETSNGDTYGSDSVIAIGENVRTGTLRDTSSSIAIGHGANAQGDRTVSVGPFTKATQNNSIAIGGALFNVPFRLESDNSTVNLESSEANGLNSIALGPKARSDSEFAISIGTGVFSSGINSIAIGRGNSGSGTNTIWATEATGENSIALGTQSACLADNAVQLGTGINNVANTFKFLDNVVANDNGLVLPVLPSYTDDANAGTAGLSTGDYYQTNGSGAAPLNVAGIVMIKQ